MDHEVMAMRMLIAFVEVVESGYGEGRVGFGVMGEAGGEVFEVVLDAGFACFYVGEAGRVS